jgi:hypothetical protein
VPTLYHRTTALAAQAILDSGFRDNRHDFGFVNEAGNPLEFEGVWLSDVPLDCNDFGHLDRDTLLAVTVDDPDLIDREVVEEGSVRSSYREWLVPAAVINARGEVRLVPSEEEEAASRRWSSELLE